jgi:hypothetical protein
MTVERRGLDGETEATFFTTSDKSFFPGTVALLNSLRLTGNQGSFVVMDVGLRDVQRSRLERHATVVRAPSEVARPVFKALPRLLHPKGAIAIIDSDIIVTDSLANVIERTVEGKICVFPDHSSQTGRWFKEWESVLELKAPLRRQTYVNSGFLALSVEHWPDFLARFWELSERVPLKAVFAGPDMSRPFWTADQDTLNAFLMSEIPPTALEILPAAQEVYPDGLIRAKVIDSETLECSWSGHRPVILHHSMNPKAWGRGGWRRVRRDAYTRLFGRVVCGKDVRLRLEPEELPLWLRPDAGGKMALRGLDVAHGIAGTVRRRLPPRTSAMALRAADRLAGLKRS